MTAFDINDHLSKLQESPYPIENEVLLSELDTAQINDSLNELIDRIATASDSIEDETVFDHFQSFIKSFSSLDGPASTKVIDLLLSGLQNETDIAAQDLESSDQEDYVKHKDLLARYIFLLQWAITSAEKRAAIKSEGVAAPKGRGKAKKVPGEWTWSQQMPSALNSICRVLDLKLGKLWPSLQDKDTFINLLTRGAYLLMENERNLKTVDVRNGIYKVVGLCVKHHNHAFGAQTSIIQNLQYFEHLSDAMAELLATLQTDFDITILTDDILKEIAAREFNGQDTKGPKSFSRFLVRLSELVPRTLLKQMSNLAKHLDTESYNMRLAVIEIIGNLIISIVNADQQDESSKIQIDSFFDVLEQRLMDVNSFCRAKVIQVYIKLCDLPAKWPRRRRSLMDLATRCLQDKSNHVRKNTIKLLTKLILTHPFGIMHGGELNIHEWKARLDGVMKAIAAIEPPDELKDADAHESEAEEQLREDLTNDKTAKLKATRTYYKDALRFINQIHNAVPMLGQLLASTNKSEVLEAIEFFRIAYQYQIEDAAEGIKRMIHLVWTKDNSDEGKGVRNCLIECYFSLYFQPQPNASQTDNINMIARNLISLTFGATLAELTSLEQLLGIMMADGMFEDDVIDKLWQVYAVQKKDIPRAQRQGAIIILGMLALAKREIVLNNMDLLLKIGLGALAQDLRLARYTCIALQRVAGNPKKVKGSLSNDITRLPMDHAMFDKLREVIELPTKSKQWFGLAEQAINTIYLLGEHPDVLCADIIREKTNAVFKLEDDHDMPLTPTKFNQAISKTMSDDEDNAINVKDSIQLSQLLFIVGHVAMKHIIHLELIETEFKRRKAEDDKAKKEEKETSAADEELDEVAGTTEDEFGEVIQNIRETELLYGPNALLAIYGPLITFICAGHRQYEDRMLQTSATLALSKLMCVSSTFCEANLPLLFTILERSSDPAIRSNVIVALGDMAVCFNNLIDQNITYLYKRLQDKDVIVKKNTLMVLTHLILNGMIKVKGQLGEMAKCLEDDEPRISDLAKLFFTELASKENAVYNNLPDIISNLSTEDNAVDEDAFKRIMKFIFDFIEKEKQAESIVEKLCQRFLNASNDRQSRDISYCLSLLPFKSERSIKKLLDGLPFYQDKLQEETVYKHFQEMITKARSHKASRPEFKGIVDELESMLEQIRLRDEGAKETEKKALAENNNAANVTRKTRSRRKKISEVEDDD